MKERGAAVFLDRDGTIIHDVGWLKDPGKIRFFPDTVSALTRLQAAGFRLFIVTNQGGVAQGALTEDDVHRVNREIENRLRKAGIEIEEWYICPHSREERCGCRKPSPYFLEKAAREHGVVLPASFVIGDHPHDPETARTAGAQGLYLLTGHGAKHLDELSRDIPVFHNLSDAVERILVQGSRPLPNACSPAAAAEALRAGRVVAFPTETVYGLGADLFQPDAVAEIFRLKGRPLYNPLIAHVADKEQVDRLTARIPERGRRLMEAFWPGPLTLVFEKRPEVPDIVTAGNPTVAVRMPEHPLARNLIRQAGAPLAAPSANAFGKTSPTTARHVYDQLGGEGYLIVDGGACRVGVESTVLSLTGPEPLLLRHGGVSREELEALIGPVRLPESSGAGRPESPGMLASHYAPHTALELRDGEPVENPDPRVGLLLFRPVAAANAGPAEILSPHGELKEAAVNLYAALRRLDGMDLERIIAYRLPDRGIGRAVNDRLKKAANPFLTGDGGAEGADGTEGAGGPGGQQ